MDPSPRIGIPRISRLPGVKTLVKIGDVFSRRRPPQGSRPGAFALDEDGVPPRLQLFEYTSKQLDERTPEDLEGVRRPGSGKTSTTWLDVQGLGDEQVLRKIGETFHIHPLALADVVNVPQRSKAEDYGTHHLIIARMPMAAENNGNYELEQVSFILGSRFLITFQERPGDVFEPVRQRIRNSGQIRRLGADYLCYALIDTLIDSYYPIIEELGEQVEQLEDAIIEETPSQQLVGRIHELRRQFLTLQRALWQHREFLTVLLREDRTPISDGVRPYVRDVFDHTVQMLEVVELYREVAVGLMDLHLSMISNRMNEIMKVLTIMASLFIPLTFVAGVYGMNFAHMPELDKRWGYPMALGAMAAIAGLLLLYFRRRGWLG